MKTVYTRINHTQWACVSADLPSSSILDDGMPRGSFQLESCQEVSENMVFKNPMVYQHFFPIKGLNFGHEQSTQLTTL